MTQQTERSEDSYPLSPMQQGMLFHTLSASHSGVDIEQMVIHLPEAVDAPALRTAWERVVQRHPVLRTAFRWEGLDEPQQEVHRHVELRWAAQGWRELSRQHQQQLLERFLEVDRQRGFRLDQPPLLRLALFRLAEAEYQLVWTFHHALLDGRSFPALLQEVFAFYEAIQRGEELQLPKPRPYRDYIDWLQQQNWSRTESFWRERLKGFTAPTPLTVDCLPTAGTQTFHSAVSPVSEPAGLVAATTDRRLAGRRYSRPGDQRENTDDVGLAIPGEGSGSESRQGDREIHLSAATTTALRTLADDNKLTLNTMLLGAWALLLSRYSDESEVVFGATRACRKSTIPGADSMAGLFINTLPVRVTADAAASLVPWLQELRAHWTALRDYEHTPLASVQNWSEVPSGQPLFESLVVFENQKLETVLRGLGGNWARRSVRLYEQTNYPLTLAAYGGPELCLKLQFDRNRFDEATVARMLGHLQTLLEGMAANPHQRLGELPWLTEAERQQLLVDWTRGAAQFAPDRTLVSWFEAQVQKTPDRVAAVCGNERCTYRELNERANRLAHHLRECGVRPETMVGLFLERSLDLVVGVLGILKAGGAYVPMDSACPRERLAFMIEDARMPVIVTQQSLRDMLPSEAANLLCLDNPRDESRIAAQSSANPTPALKATNLAYVIYTSGSTGKPKGVLVTHHNVVRLFQATERWFEFNEADVWTLFHSVAFDFSVWEMWGALLYGGKLVVVPYLISRSPEAFCELLACERVTVLNQTPSAFRQLMQAEAARPAAELALRYVIFGGEALELHSLKPWFDRHGDQRPQLVNMYGITETTVHVTYRPLTKVDLDSGSVVGQAISDLKLYLLDSNRQPVPIGVPGEIYVGGAGLARGYLRRPELTAERFVPNPFEPGTRFYRSGDRARFLPNGDIEYLGRTDFQVKIRGFRIELREIESVLCAHPAVREAVVLAREDGAGDKRLTAYVVSGARIPAVNELREHLKAQLPDYMVPAVFVMLERLPLTDNGKVDRQALPAPEPQRPDLASPFVAPSSATEQQLAELWKRVLRVDRVGVNDNFFELGGNSLLMVQLLGKSHTALKADLQITHLFQYPNVRALAAYLDRQRSTRPSDKVLQRARRQAAALAERMAVMEESVQ